MNQHSLKIDKLNCVLELSWFLKVMLLKSVVSSSKRLSHSRTALPAACDSRMAVLNFCSILNEWCSYLNGSQFIQILEEDIGFILCKGPPFWERNCINPVKKAGPHVPQRYPNAVSQTVKSVASASLPPSKNDFQRVRSWFENAGYIVVIVCKLGSHSPHLRGEYKSTYSRNHWTILYKTHFRNDHAGLRDMCIPVENQRALRINLILCRLPKWPAVPVEVVFLEEELQIFHFLRQFLEGHPQIRLILRDQGREKSTHKRLGRLGWHPELLDMIFKTQNQLHKPGSCRVWSFWLAKRPPGDFFWSFFSQAFRWKPF